MEKEKVLYLWEEGDEYGIVRYQTVSSAEENEDDVNIKFSVCNLNECPEDAIIGRSLFDATDYLQALRTGMKLAQAGYTDVRFADVRG